MAALRAFWALTPRQVNLSWDIDYFINIMIAVFYLNHIQNKFFNLGAADMDRRRWAGCLGSRRSGAIDAEAFNYEYGNGGRFNEQLNS